MGSFIMGLNVNIVAWNHFVNGMLFNLIKNLYVPFGIPFDPKRYYKDGDYARMLRWPRYGSSTTRSEAPVFNFEGLPDLMAEGLSIRMLMEHMDAQGYSLERLYLTCICLELYSFSWVELGGGTAPSYTFNKDPMLRLCHRLIACSITGRSQAPEKGLTVIAPALPIVYMTELVRLQLCVELDDTWAWVPARPARQEGGAGGVTEEAPVAPGGGDEDEEMP
ncbi:hypothetical protein Tco_0195197 [Tanacetum coccineum]